ncbi:MAG TPA: hypothetical protein VNI84_03375, partial [Pyrinomonadaceae bacterium]|nr:hypothetical protein [Pyrinomonadaceae bacterium]
MENITLKIAVNKLANRKSVDAIENRKLFDDDHLQVDDGYKGYIGLLPAAGDPSYSFTTKWLERIFAATNLVKSAVARNLDGILSGEPDWNLLLPEENGRAEAFAEEASEALVDWWNDASVLQTIFREAAKTVLLEAECYVRPILPKSKRDAGDAEGFIKYKKDLREAFGVLDYEIVSKENAGIFIDSETGRKFSVCRIEADKTKEVEISWVEDDGLTRLKILRDDELKLWTDSTLSTIGSYFSASQIDTETISQALDLGGRLYLHKLTREMFITETARSLQRSVNYSLTTMNKNLNIAGSRETGYGNAQKPKKTIVTKDALGKITSITQEDAPLVKGASNANFFAGLPVYDPEKRDASGNPIVVDYKQPVQFVVDPVAVDTFVKSFSVFELLFLREVKQSHILANEQAAISGISKKEGRDDYKKSLKASKTAVDPAGRYVMGFTLMFGANLANRAGDFAGARFDFNCQVDAGAVDPEELKQESDDVASGKSTLYSYLIKKGVEDPDAEIARIKSSDGYLLTQVNAAVDLWTKGNGKLS